MLSRTAEGLFWIGRYIERADNIARLVEAGRRFDGIAAAAPPTPKEVEAEPISEWGAMLAAAGCRYSFPSPVETAAGPDAVRHMLSSPANPSSLRGCFEHARANARAQRVALTSEVWTAINDSWRELRALEVPHSQELTAVLERARALAALVWGTIDGTQLRSEGYYFMRLGQFIERADATARLLDVKHEALRRPAGVETVQWAHILRAAGGFMAYRRVYRRPPRHDLIADFLILNPKSPRSLRFCYEEIRSRLDSLLRLTGAAHASAAAAEARRAALANAEAKQIIEAGLHEYLTDIILETNTLATMIADDFGFGLNQSQGARQIQTQFG